VNLSRLNRCHPAVGSKALLVGLAKSNQMPVMVEVAVPSRWEGEKFSGREGSKTMPGLV